MTDEKYFFGTYEVCLIRKKIKKNINYFELNRGAENFLQSVK